MTLLVLPIVLPLLSAAFSLLAWNNYPLQRVLSSVGMSALLSAAIALLWRVWQAGVQATHIGDWPAPFGITLVADTFSALMVLLAAMAGLLTVVYSFSDIGTERERFGYHPLLQIMIMGVCGAFLTGDIFNLFVWFEVLLIASFGLMALGGESTQIRGAIIYVVLNLLASTLFLVALGILYGLAGTLNMADLALKLRNAAQPGLVSTLAVLFLLVFGIKAALFPLFFWLPDSYPASPVVVSAVFAALLTKVGIYALLRVFTLIFTRDVGYTQTLLLLIAGLTMLVGVLGALAQREFRRVLSFLIISQMGYITMGLGLYTPSALGGAIFYIVEDVIALQCLFLVSGVIYRLHQTNQLAAVGGIYQGYPWIALLYLIPALSLAGLPPLAGFVGKLALVQSGLAIGQYAIVATALLVALCTLLCVGRLWSSVFWRVVPRVLHSAAPLPRQQMALLIMPIVVLASLTVLLGLFAEPVLRLSFHAADQLWNPSAYIQAVLGRER